MEQNTEKFSILNSQFSILTSYFPDLTDRQKEQYAALYDLYTDWNAKINVISRKAIAAFQAGFLGDGSGYGRRFSRHPLGDLIPGDPFPSGRQHREKNQGGTSRGRGDRAGEHILPPLPGRGGKAAFRFRGKPCRDASGGSGKARPQEYKERTDQRVAQRIDLPERWRAGARDIAFPEPSDKHGSERPF